jgi:DNA modification methylase
MCGDSTVDTEVKRLLAGEKIDMVFTDPPYGVSYADKNEMLNAYDKGNSIQKAIAEDHLSEKEIQAFWKKSFTVIRDNLADENSYYITGPQIQGMMMMMMMMQESGLPYRHVIIWVKNVHVLGRCDYHYRHEPIFFGWTKRHRFYGGGKFQTSVWEVDKPHKNDLHPTMKPVALPECAILNSSAKDAVVFDGFLGSGSTLIAAEKTGRVCYGMEIDPKYCDVIIRRYAEYTGTSEESIRATREPHPAK